MARTGLQEFLAIQSPLQSWNFDVFVARVPGIGDTRELTYKCTSANFPDAQIEPVLVEGHGVQLRSAGRRLWTGTWTMNVIETSDGATRPLLIQWMNLCRDTLNNSGNFKTTYAVPVEVTLYDDIPNPVRSAVLYNAWVSNVAEVSLSQASTAIEYAVTFTYDFVDEL